MQSIRGMHDILPDEISYWQHIYNMALKILNTANYKEIRTPIVESTSLFLRSIGQDTDIVNKEMYTFLDQGKRHLTLRPEGTASIARAIIQHKLCEPTTIQRVWYLGPMFRYERPQQGRQRQFHQLGLECYGSINPIVDAEIIYLAQTILHALECTDFTIEINSIGTLENREEYKIRLRHYLEKYKNDLDNESQSKLYTNPLRILDSKEPKIHEILYYAPNLADCLDPKSMIHFQSLQEYLKSLNIKFKINRQLVRGLDYYNDTVFEINTNLLGTQGTICGGGRYDSLTEQLGGKRIPAVGWGIGIERLLLLIKDKIELKNNKLCIYIATQNSCYLQYSLQIIPIIQQYGLKYELDLSGSVLKKQLQKALKKQAMLCLIIGEEEVKNSSITLKWLTKYDQYTYTISDFINLVPNIYAEYLNFNPVKPHHINVGSY
uniref:Histidine--tRNA ligase, chloroplastic n=1 Tax=Liagoropsis maxima TaxID=1653392 RepID=A0A1G4NW80_9FLOR|nr:Histidine-tRNA ligase [Liagoropsis maxima]SCW22874.1 Histidine-tRNA ligase [Liagoropsis maxima]